MKKLPLLAVVAFSSVLALAQQHFEGFRPAAGEPMTFTADSVAVDNVTKVAVASGHVYAVYAPFSLRSEKLERDAEGVFRFHGPTTVTTCTNEVGHTHWNLTGDVEYKSKDYVILRDACLRLYEVPVMYLPYLWYPLDWQCGFEWMPGYTGRWGAFLLTKYSYDLIGTASGDGHTDRWLRGVTAFDYRYKNGVALGQDLKWNLGDFGSGKFRIYYAWDQYADHRYNKRKNDKYRNWGSTVDEDRYAMSLSHHWQATERDTVFLRGSFNSDSYFTKDFIRRNFFELKEAWETFRNSGVFWEHLENNFIIGAEVSGRLNDFYAATERLPEIYFDVNPMPVFGLPVNYETQNRIGWLDRRYAEFASGKKSVFGTNPGVWAKYDTLRFDTYHRLTAPFKLADDVVSIVPRVGYHGTYWSESGRTDVFGTGRAGECGSMFRSIGETGATFAARGQGWVNDEWQHTIEPYFDVLAQKAWFSGDNRNNRPYIFDNIDASMAWEDQFAGRGRNLPYSYYGVTPGLRNDWGYLLESGEIRQALDFDVYAAVMFDKAEYVSDPAAGSHGNHALAKLGGRNYGHNDISVMPGARLKWDPADDISLAARAEYDTDHNQVALGGLNYRQTVSKNFKYSVSYDLRDYRYWDFSSTPKRPNETRKDNLNRVYANYVHLKCEYQPIDWFAVGPFIRWDLNDNELDAAGSWFDYMTDCLGFRFLVKYTGSYERIDGHKYDHDWSVGFYVYLRALGSDPGNIFAH